LELNMLASLINQHALDDAKAGKWDSVAEILNAPTVEVRDTTLRTTGWLMQSLTAVIDPATGMTEADLVLGTLQRSTTPRVRAAYDRMSSIGLDLSDPQAQELIPTLGAAANWPADLIAKIATAGVRMVPIAGDIVTANQCEAAWIASLKSAALERVINAACEAAREEYRDAESTPESIVAAAVAVLESHR
jgi:hypothetical protein